MKTRYLLPIISCLCGVAAIACNGGDDIGPLDALLGRGGASRGEASDRASGGRESLRLSRRIGRGEVECSFGDEGPCEVFVSRDVEVPLGPYGADMETNVGRGFENMVPLSDVVAELVPGSGLVCSLVDVLGAGVATGLPLLDTDGLNFSLYTVYGPADLPEGERYPVIVWGNGPCIPPEGYGAFLRLVASQGYIVVAPNNRLPREREIIRAIDYIFDANEDRRSPYYGVVDTSRVGAMGHSLGANAVARAADEDSRIETVVLFNSDELPEVPYLAISADDDARGLSVSQLQDALDDAFAGAFIVYHRVDGGGLFPGQYLLMSDPERVLEPAWRWFEYYFFDDQDSIDLFVGRDCDLCRRTREYTYDQAGLR